MVKRFKKEFLRKKSYFTKPLWRSLNGKKYRGVVQTSFTIYNWFYGRNENELLEVEFLKLLEQEEPEEINENIFEPILEPTA